LENWMPQSSERGLKGTMAAATATRKMSSRVRPLTLTNMARWGSMKAGALPDALLPGEVMGACSFLLAKKVAIRASSPE
jgi:hypothetical protein